MTDDLPGFIERYHEAARRFARADPNGVKDLYSRQDDVVLANPFGPAVMGWVRSARGSSSRRRVCRTATFLASRR